LAELTHLWQALGIHATSRTLDLLENRSVGLEGIQAINRFL
jgi:hypothetical protein